MLDIVFNPFIENDAFKQEYVEGEKQNLKQIIEAKIDNKSKYAYDRCTEEMFKNEPYGLYKFGYIEDLEKITPQNLYAYYQKLLQTCKIDIFVSGDIENKDIKEIMKQNETVQLLQGRKPEYVINNETTEKRNETNTPKEVTESMQITQGKLVIGLDINKTTKNSRFIASVYNAILGGGANSKLFQNVREKQSLAYTANSGYVRTKNSIFIRCGIEIANYEKALDTIKKQLEDMKQGNFTQEDLQNSKELILASIEGITEEQDTEITYYYGQELANTFVTIQDYMKNIKDVTKEQVVELANNISINTIYFLKD